MINVRIKGLSSFANRMGSMPRLIESGLNEALLRSGFKVEEESKRETPVDTGLLRASIRTKKGKNKVIVGPHTQYALFVHEGLGSNISYGKRPFMETGLNNSVSFINRELKGVSDAIKKRFK